MTTMCPLNKVMLQRRELLKIKRNQTMCPMMLQGGKLLKMKRNQCPMMMISAGDLIALYLGLELQSLALYVLAAVHRNDHDPAEAEVGTDVEWFF